MELGSCSSPTCGGPHHPRCRRRLFVTINGCFMNFAYDWAFAKPIRKVTIFVVTWIAALAIWRFGKIEQKRDGRQAVPDGTAD
jgi:hypothetical protein